MKVGVVVDNEYHSDVRVKREVSMLKSYGYQVYILCLSFQETYIFQEKGTEIVPLHLSRKIKNVLYFFMNLVPLYERWWMKKVSQFVNKYEVDVVHTHDLYMSKCVMKGVKKSRKEIPMILDLHENYPHAIQSYKWAQGIVRSLLVRPKLWIKKEAQYLAYPDRIVVLSTDFKHTLLSRYSFLKAEKVLAFPNVVDTDEFDKYPIKGDVDKILPDGPRVLYFGMVASRRGIFRSLDVCEALLNKGVNLSLVIIGPVDAGDKEMFFNKIQQPLFTNHLKYIPWIDISELPSYLNACDIALAPFDKNPQHESGIANKIFQYMYGSLPILASNCKPQQELIEKYEIGEVFSSGLEFEEKLQYLLENEEVRKFQGNIASKVLMTDFHQQAFASKLKAFYEDLLTSVK